MQADIFGVHLKQGNTTPSGKLNHFFKETQVELVWNQPWQECSGFKPGANVINKFLTRIGTYLCWNKTLSLVKISHMTCNSQSEWSI